MAQTGIYLNVLDFGARPNSFEDDTAAFTQAMEKQRATHCTLYVPEGIYYISKPLSLLNCNLKGAGLQATCIISCDPTGQPILYMGRSCVVSDLTLSFKPELLSRNEKQGEFVGVCLRDENNVYRLQRGSALRNVQISNTGTAIFDGDDMGDRRSAFSITFDSLEISDFTFRGVDFCSVCRTGSVFSNVYMSSACPNVDTMMRFCGEDSELTMQQVNLTNTCCRCALHLEDVRGFNAATLHILGVTTKQAGDCLIRMEGSVADIGTLTVYYSLLVPGSSLIDLGSSEYDIRLEWADFRPATMGHLHIGNLNVKGLNDPTRRDPAIRRGIDRWQEDGCCFFHRAADAPGSCTVQVDHYSWYTFQNDRDAYDAMPRDPHGRITFRALGTLPLGGNTADRPVNRLCPFATRYFDTDLGREVIWDGSAWR